MLYRSLRSVLTLLLVSLGLVFAANTPAFACDCKAQDEQRLLAAADVVFVGTVERIIDLKRDTTYQITATHSFKGEVESATSIVSTTGGCGLEAMVVGNDYLFLAKGGAAPYRADQCGGTGRATTSRIAAIEAVAGVGTEIAEPPPPTANRTHVEESRPRGFARTAAPGAVAVLVGLLGLLFVRLRQRRG